MELAEVVRKRRMRRGFDRRPLAAGLVDRLLALAMTAPSAGFSQGVDWLVLDTPEAARLFFEGACDAEFVADPGPMAGLLRAPVIAVPCADPAAYLDRYAQPDKASSPLAGLRTDEWPIPYWTVDAAFAVMLLLLGAEEAGLAALFFRLHRPAANVLRQFGGPLDREIIGAVALGWPDLVSPGPPGSPSRRERRTAGEMLHRNRW